MKATVEAKKFTGTRGQIRRKRIETSGALVIGAEVGTNVTGPAVTGAEVPGA